MLILSPAEFFRLEETTKFRKNIIASIRDDLPDALAPKITALFNTLGAKEFSVLKAISFRLLDEALAANEKVTLSAMERKFETENSTNISPSAF